MIRRFWMVPLAIALAAMPLYGQNASTTHGFALGAHLLGASLDPEDGENDTGGGIGIVAAYGFRSGLSIFLNATAAAMNPDEEGVDNYALAQADLGVRYMFGNAGQRFRPYLAGALSGISVSWEDVDFFEFEDVDIEFSGPAFTAGGGVQYYFSPRWALDASLLWSTGSFDEVKIDNVTVELDEEDEFKVNTFRLQLGFQYYFSGGKD